MPKYKAEPGQEDRHGEMTGAITFNMILVFPVLLVYCMFIAPPLMGVTWAIITGLILAVVLTIIGIPISRRLWAWFSEKVDDV